MQGRHIHDENVTSSPYMAKTQRESNPRTFICKTRRDDHIANIWAQLDGPRVERISIQRPVKMDPHICECQQIQARRGFRTSFTGPPWSLLTFLLCRVGEWCSKTFSCICCTVLSGLPKISTYVCIYPLWSRRWNACLRLKVSSCLVWDCSDWLAAKKIESWLLLPAFSC